ncbi:MAG: hypothetical protein QW404_02180 [Candidatus Nanoarchaeia archaeon]
MSIDHVLEKTIIKLPRPLSLKETEDLIEYIAEQLPGDIYYKISRNKSVIKNPEGILKFDGSGSISANIKSYKSGAYENFSCEPDDFTKDSKISAIKFTTVPGWKLFDYRKEVVELWHEVGKIVAQYFDLKK